MQRRTKTAELTLHPCWPSHINNSVHNHCPGLALAGVCHIKPTKSVAISAPDSQAPTDADLGFSCDHTPCILADNSSKETRAPAYPLNSVSLTHCCCNQTSSTKLRSFCTLNLSQVTTLAVFDSHFSCPYVPPSLASKGPCTNPRLRFCFIPLILGMPSV